MSGPASAEEAILIDPAAPRQVAFEASLFGYKRFPQQIFTAQKGEQFGIPTELIYTSASSIPAIEQEAAASGRDVFDLDASQVVALLRSKHRQRVGVGRDVRSSTTIIPWVDPPEVDAEFVTALVSSELVSNAFRVFDGEIIGNEVEMISVDNQVARDFWKAYSSLDSLNAVDPFEKLMEFDRVEANLVRYPILLQSAKISFSPVSFGEIFVYSSDDRGLRIPPPISKKYDVYWVEFPVSLRDLSDDYVVEISFHVFLPDDSRALDLIPRRFGIERDVTEEVSSPEFTVRDVSLGEFYNRTVSYTTLKPTIVATGLREHKFSWVLTGEAVSTGSYLFVGVLGVPKSRCKISTGLGVNAKTTDFLGLQGNVAGTGVILTEIELPC